MKLFLIICAVIFVYTALLTLVLALLSANNPENRDRGEPK